MLGGGRITDMSNVGGRVMGDIGHTSGVGGTANSMGDNANATGGMAVGPANVGGYDVGVEMTSEGICVRCLDEDPWMVECSSK